MDRRIAPSPSFCRHRGEPLRDSPEYCMAMTLYGNPMLVRHLE